MRYIKFFKEISAEDTSLVGGKNANLGEMYNKLADVGVPVPNGFAVTAEGYDYFIKFNNLEEKIHNVLKGLDTHNIEDLHKRGEEIRNLIKSGEFPEDLKNEILGAFQKLKEEYGEDLTVAVRSSATAEDTEIASFAGQQETYLNVNEKDLLEKIKFCFASLFTDRAISYREDKGFDHFKVKLSVAVQKMVRSDVGSSGVMFTIDPDNGCPNFIVINSVFGLGELIVQGKVIPDEFMVFKSKLPELNDRINYPNDRPNNILEYKPNENQKFGPNSGNEFGIDSGSEHSFGYNSGNSFGQDLGNNFVFPIISKKLGEKNRKIVYAEEGGVKEVETTEEERKMFSLTDEEARLLAKYGYLIEKHYGKAMDIEWAKDGIENKLYIVQARPETVHSTKQNVWYEYRLKTKTEPILKGIAIGSQITAGKVRVIKDVEKIREFQSGEILVTEMTDPDWEPIMKIAKGIITEKGGRTCFAGDTKILTNKGFMTIEDLVKKYNNEEIKVLSLNPKTLRLKWKKVINGFEREAKVIKINVSQTGRAKNNFLKVTPDHKFLTFKNRQLIEIEIQKIIKNQYGVLSIKRLPASSTLKINHELGYILGAIFTDGHIYLSKTHGEVRFIQKEIPEKLEFINKLKDYWFKLFNKDLRRYKENKNVSYIRGRKVKGKATHFRCYSKNLALKLKTYFEKIDKIILSASKEFVLEFLAGVTDGDGTYSTKDNRINIFVSKEKLLQAIILACLRLNIPFQVSRNRNIYNIQLVENFEEIFRYTARVKGKPIRIKFGSIFFNAKQLLSDIIEKVNYKGRIKPYVLNNLLIDADKITKYIIPMIKGSLANHELTKIIKSDLKMLRVTQETYEEITKVYNITVEDNHNYVVFTSKYTPVIVVNCHAAIVARELGIPAIVGVSGALEKLKTGDEITIDNSQGLEGKIYQGILEYEVIEHKLEEIPQTKTKVYVNIGEPDEALEKWYLPVKGVGLAREEFIIASEIKIHPNALIDYENLKKKVESNPNNRPNKLPESSDRIDSTRIERPNNDIYPNKGPNNLPEYQPNENQKFGPDSGNEFGQNSGRDISKIIEKIDELTKGYEDKKQFYIDKLAEGIAKIGVAFWPNEVIVRFSDFKTNEYRNLIGGEIYEPKEENPMIGWRGASRYYHPNFRKAFELEVLAIKKVREEMKLKNVVVMVPFCRTPEEGREVVQIIRSIIQDPELKIYVMCEIPSNVLLVDEFLEIFDGMSIGSNDLTQLVLGIDRDNEMLTQIGDERNPAVLKMLEEVIKKCKEKNKYIGICGQAPSDFPEIVEFLVKNKIDSISVNPDAVIKTINLVKEVEGS
jgi:pyruvate, water dikinase